MNPNEKTWTKLKLSAAEDYHGYIVHLPPGGS
jgi:hypothetical protein